MKERSKHIYDCVIKLTRKTDFKLSKISVDDHKLIQIKVGRYLGNIISETESIITELSGKITKPFNFSWRPPELADLKTKHFLSHSKWWLVTECHLKFWIKFQDQHYFDKDVPNLALHNIEMEVVAELQVCQKFRENIFWGICKKFRQITQKISVIIQLNSFFQPQISMPIQITTKILVTIHGARSSLI